MLASLKTGVTAMGTILVLDMIWLGFIANRFYISQMGHLARMEDGKMKPILWPAGLVYIVLAVGVVYFALPKVAPEEPLWHAYLWGALLGLVIYGCYDMTNYSTVNAWPLTLAWVDMAWGAMVCGLATLAAKFVRDL